MQQGQWLEPDNDIGDRQGLCRLTKALEPEAAPPVHNVLFVQFSFPSTEGGGTLNSKFVIIPL